MGRYTTPRGNMLVLPVSDRMEIPKHNTRRTCNPPYRYKQEVKKMELQKQEEIKQIARLVAAEIIAELQQYEIRHTVLNDYNQEIIKGYFTVERAGTSYSDEILGRKDRINAAERRYQQQRGW